MHPDEPADAFVERAAALLRRGQHRAAVATLESGLPARTAHALERLYLSLG